jgi:hypothetical protein
MITHGIDFADVKLFLLFCIPQTAVEMISMSVVSYMSLNLTKHYTMKAYWGVEVQLHAFFGLGTRWR